MTAKLPQKPFQVRVPDDVLDDLRQRLARARCPTSRRCEPWTHGNQRRLHATAR